VIGVKGVVEMPPAALAKTASGDEEGSPIGS
jgi:hypothetical protein